LAITITVAVLLSYIAALIVIPLAAWSGVERVDSEPGASHIADTPGTAILLVGSDSRDAMTEEEREELGVGNAYGKRTDTMMIYFIPKSGPAVLLSLPRDTYIDIPGVGYDKLNAAHAYGGAPLLVETVEVRTGIRIDGYLEVGMAEFANLIDYVGGLDVCIDYDVADPDSNLYLNAGCHHLDGAQGLAYVRMRYADPRGDLGRVERQREAVSQVMDKVAVKSNVLLPWRWYSTTHALVDLITAGEDTSILDMFSAGLGALDFVSGNGLQLTVPISNPGADTEVGSAVIWDDDAADELFALLRSGDTTGVERFVK
jgi:LCP family protein required for cell wall assembly